MFIILNKEKKEKTEEIKFDGLVSDKIVLIFYTYIV